MINISNIINFSVFDSTLPTVLTTTLARAIGICCSRLDPPPPPARNFSMQIEKYLNNPWKAFATQHMQNANARDAASRIRF